MLIFLKTMARKIWKIVYIQEKNQNEISLCTYFIQGKIKLWLFCLILTAVEVI